MKREDFKQIIRLRIGYQINEKLIQETGLVSIAVHSYVKDLIESQMELDHLGIKEDGNLYKCSGGDWNIKTKDFDNYVFDDEICSYDLMERRISKMIDEILS